MKNKNGICLALCINYLYNDISLEQLKEAIYGKKKAYVWKENLEILLEKYGYRIAEQQVYSIGHIIEVLKYRKKSHAVLLYNGVLELNPYATKIDNMETHYFLRIYNKDE